MFVKHVARGIVLLAVTCAASTLVYAAQKPDFSGTWRVDHAKSTSKTTALKPADPNALPPPPPPPPPPPGEGSPTHVVTHRDPALTIKEGRASVLTLTTDGKENVNRVSNRTVNRSVTTWDGDKLVTKWTMEIDGEKAAEGTDVRSITENGAVMIDERTIKWPSHETKAHIVLRRQ